MNQPGPSSRLYTIRGANQNGKRRHLKLVPREQETYNAERFEWRCIRCGGPREPHSFPVGPCCQTGGEAA